MYILPDNVYTIPDNVYTTR